MCPSGNFGQLDKGLLHLWIRAEQTGLPSLSWLITVWLVVSTDIKGAKLQQYRAVGVTSYFVLYGNTTAFGLGTTFHVRLGCF